MSDADAPLFPAYSQAEGDRLYEVLIQAHQGLSEADSHRLNARLVLMLLSALGDAAGAEAVLTAARSGFASEGG